MALENTDGTLWGAIGATAVAVGAFVRWWYHVRRLENADRVDGSVSRSISFVLNELREEIERLKRENASLHDEIAQLRAGREPYGL